MDPERVQVIAEWPIPQTFSSFLRFLQLLSTVHSWILQTGTSYGVAERQVMEGNLEVSPSMKEVQAFQDLVDLFSEHPCCHFEESLWKPTLPM